MLKCKNTKRLAGQKANHIILGWQKITKIQKHKNSQMLMLKLKNTKKLAGQTANQIILGWQTLQTSASSLLFTAASIW